MNLIHQYLSMLSVYLPALAIFITVVAVLKVLGFWVSKQRPELEYKRTLIPHFLMVTTAIGGLLLIILSMPLSDTTRGHILGLVGVVLTGIFALSSTTFVTNALAGLMLRLIKNYKTGDFIQVNENFGRITERGLFHTEIQTQERNLTTFPNIYLVTNPMTVLRSSGTIISASLSLGYDVPHQKVERHLNEAAEKAGLAEPFVQVVELGDFSVIYKISGFLSETKQLLASRSNLKRSLLDVLHQAGIEIVSPNFINQRVMPKDAAVIPEMAESTPEFVVNDPKLPEEVIFDKAETAQEMDQWRERLSDLTQKLNSLGKKKNAPNIKNRARLEAAIQKIQKKIEQFDQLLKTDKETKKA